MTYIVSSGALNFTHSLTPKLPTSSSDDGKMLNIFIKRFQILRTKSSRSISVPLEPTGRLPSHIAFGYAPSQTASATNDLKISINPVYTKDRILEQEANGSVI